MIQRQGEVAAGKDKWGERRNELSTIHTELQERRVHLVDPSAQVGTSEDELMLIKDSRKEFYQITRDCRRPRGSSFRIAGQVQEAENELRDQGTMTQLDQC